MTRKASVREVREHIGELLDAVEAGGQVVVTRRGKPVARIVPETPGPRADALQSTRLPGAFHRDPTDRFIVVLARRLGAPVVTSDRRIREYEHVESIW